MLHIFLLIPAINSLLCIERWFIRCVRKINKYYLATDVEHLSELTVANKVYYFPVWVMKYSRRKTFATRFITIYNLDEKTKTNKSKRRQWKKGQHTRLEKWVKRKWRSRCRWSLFACLTFLMFVFSLFFIIISGLRGVWWTRLLVAWHFLIPQCRASCLSIGEVTWAG